MSDKRKTVVTAILNVHSGSMTPEQAEKFVGGSSTADGAASVILTGDDGETKEMPVQDIVNNVTASRKALEGLGIDEEKQDTLFNMEVGKDPKDTKILRDTLEQIASKVEPISEKLADSNAATLPPKEDDRSGETLRLTTDSFFANYGLKSERYDVLKEFARGGMGRVLLAKDKNVGRDVALKELLPELLSGSSLGGASVGFAGSAGPGSFPKETSASQGIVERFLREAKITGQLEHPNIVPVYEIGKDDDGDYYYTMRFIKGKTLADRLREIRKDTSLDEPERFAARIKLLDSFVDICNAIAYAHSRGVIHRDIKPENIMLGDFGETLVLDWGLARVKGQKDRNLDDFKRGTIAMSQSLFNADSEALTMDGSVVGTPAYMAPEQARGDLEDVDDQSDVYALGAVLYQILTGYPPYEGPMAALIVQQVLSGPPLSSKARESQIPPELNSLIERSMARDKVHRLRTALELASEVKAFRDGRTLGSYSYSSREMLVRFLKQHRTTVGISALCFLLLIAAGIYSYGQIVEEKEVAEGAQRVAESRAEETKAALGVAEKERHAKEKAELDKHEAAKAAYLEKAEVAPDLIRNLENRQIAPFLEQLDGELLDLNQRYATRTDGGYMPLPVAEQKENKQLLDRLITYLSMKTRLLRLFSTPEGVEPTQVLQQIDKSALAAEVSTVRLKMAKLASFNANFELAGEILAGSVSKGLEVSNVSAEVSAYRTSALSFQASRISILMSSVDDGLNEVRGTEIWGPIPAQVDAIVDELKLYQNRKALASLKSEIAPLVAKLKSKQALTRVEIDKIVVVAKAISGFQFKTQAVAIIEEILVANSYPRIRDEMVLALTSNGSPVALEALIRIAHVRGRHFFEKYKDSFAEFPLPARLRNPSSAADYTDRALFLLATDKLDEATDSALRGVNMDQKGLIPLLVQAEIHVAKDEIGQALEAAKAAIALDASSYNAKLLYADVLNLQVSSKAIAAFDEAIKLDPTRETGYVQKARALVNRPTRWDAVPVLEEAVKNAHVPHRSLILLARLQSIWKIQRNNYDLGHALETCKKSLELDPGYFEAYAQICWQARRGVDGGFGVGTAAGQHATTLNPKDTATFGQLAEIYFGRGLLYECEQAGMKNPESSLATYYAAIAITQKYGNHDYLIWQSRWLTGSASTHSMWRDRTRDLNRAVELLRNSTKADPNDIRVKWMLTETLLALRKFKEAEEVLVGLFEVAPASNTPYLPWAVTMFRKWHKGLSHLELLDVDLETDVTENIETQRKRMQKIQLLAVCTEDIDKNMFGHIFANTDVEPRFREAIRLLELVRKDYSSMVPSDKLEFLYTEDSLIDAIRPHSYRSYVDAYIKLCEARIAHGVNVTDFARQDLVHAYVAQASLYQYRYSINLGVDEATQRVAVAEFRALTDEQRLQKVEEYKKLIYESMESAVVDGVKFYSWSGSKKGALNGDKRFNDLLTELTKNEGLGNGPAIMESELIAWGVTEKHPAWVAGLREGDAILNIDGKTFDSANQLADYLTTLTPDDKISIKIRRYAVSDGHFVALVDDQGEPLTDELGRAQLEFEEFTFNMKGGYMGFIVTTGVIPLWLTK